MIASRALCFALLAALPLARGGAQPAPYHHYRTLDTPHFRVHVAQGLEREGRVAAAAAERAYAALARELTEPRGAIDLVVTDDADYSNGFATPLPTNRIVVFANPPIENQGLRVNEDWLALVVTHELTHIFHLDRSRGVWGAAQHLFGRAPFLFPNLYGPAWLTEGLAVYYESRLTEGGRLKDAESRMLARASAAEHRLPRLDELSLGSPRFPGGQGAYAYGALFMDYLARTRGDSAVRRFVEAQSAQLIPFALDRAARRGFGVSFSGAFAEWRDSVERSAGAPVPPLAGWRELTAQGYYAANPRWLNDSTLVYVGTDGRETNGAYAVTTSRVRTPLGRRNGAGANVPLADGGYLYAQLDFTTPSEVRSDLYRSSRDGRVTRLTEGARLVEPDVRRADGAIVAVRLAAARSSLVLLDSAGRLQRVLRGAGPDESWSDPRWSPNGNQIAAVHRRHGGEFSLEIIHVITGDSDVADRGRYAIAAPAWTSDGKFVYYTSEASGVPQLAAAFGGDRHTSPSDRGGSGIFTPDISPSGRAIAATALRADGYHVGVAALDSPTVQIATGALDAAEPARADSQELAPGDFRVYSPWASLLPRYWYPVVESGPASTTRLGFTTSGTDVVRRHLYDAYAAIPTTGRFAIGGIAYRYAGLRRPFVDATVSQDWTSQGRLIDASNNVVGTLLKRTQDASLAATFVRPRVRSYASFTAGLGVERRRFATDPAPLLAQLDTSFGRSYTFPRAFVGASWANYQRPPLSISPEDGVALAFTARERYRTDAASGTASASVVGTAAAYKSLDFPGFAHHALALRLAGGWADRRTGTALEVGGTSGSTVQIIPGYTVGEGRRTFGVRGFPTASLYGTQAATASLEYRAPLSLGGRGLALLPFFLDRSSLSAFADAGAAGCVSSPLYSSVCAPQQLLARPIASVGAELGISAAIFSWDSPQAIRVGVAAPVAGRERVQQYYADVRPVSAYLAFGLSF